MYVVDNSKSYACEGAEVYGKTLYFSQFCCTPKTALTNSLKIIFIQEKWKNKKYIIFSNNIVSYVENKRCYIMNNWNGVKDSVLEVVVTGDNSLAKTWIKSFECSPNKWRKNILV